MGVYFIICSILLRLSLTTSNRSYLIEIVKKLDKETIKEILRSVLEYQNDWLVKVLSERLRVEEILSQQKEEIFVDLVIKTEKNKLKK